MFKLPMDPKSSTKMLQLNMMDKSQKSPLMRPDSHGEFQFRHRIVQCHLLHNILNLISQLTKSSQSACLLNGGAFFRFHFSN